MSIDSGDDFLQRYLEHLERRASQDGINKWLLIAAFAAIVWQLLGVFQGAQIGFVLEWVGIILALYVIVDVIQSLIQPVEVDGGGLRVRPKSWAASAESKDASFMVFRFSLLTYIFVQYFEGLGLEYRAALVGVFAFLLFIGLLLLANVFRRYEAKIPSSGGDQFFRLLIGVLGVSVVFGLYGVFSASDRVAALLGAENIDSLRAIVLVVAAFFVVSKYIEKLKIDSEIVAVRRLWRRRGVGEIDKDEAARELKLIIHGATLGEVISGELAALSRRFSDVAENVEAAYREADSLATVADQVAKDALKNSLSFRRERLAALLFQIDSECEQIKRKLKSLVGEDGFKHSDCRDFVRDLDARCDEQHVKADEAISVIEGAIDR